MADKRLVLRIYKEHLHNNKTENLIEKWATDLSTHSTK